MTNSDKKIEHIKAVIEFAKKSPLFRHGEFLNYVCAILDEPLMDYWAKNEIIDIDQKNMYRLSRRMETIRTIVSNLVKFESEEIKKYIIDSILGEMGMAYSIGRYGSGEDIQEALK